MRRQGNTRRSRAPAGLGLIVLAACSGSNHGTHPSPHPSAHASASALPATALDPALAARLVRAVGDADEAAVARLGIELGARPLVAAVADDTYRRTALLAIPHAEDAETALDELADHARTHPRDDEAVLDAIARIVAEPRFDELLEPEGIVRCHALLGQIAVDPTRSATARALAETASKRVEEYARGRLSFTPASPRR